MKIFQPILALTLFITFIHTNDAHGLCSWPRARGLTGINYKGMPILRRSDTTDWASQGLNSGGRWSVSKGFSKKWTPYEPTDLSYPFRHDHGLCGDRHDRAEHMAPYGKYYNGLTIGTYEEGDYIDMEAFISAHHLGYFEFYVCNLDCCSASDIGENCFRQGCCRKLLRVAHPHCESGNDRVCGPIDWRYPGRWYLPPADMRDPTHNWYGGSNRKMRYILPKGFTCSRCVIHWYWACANYCNPPGYADYKFPWVWAGIPGERGALGSINRNHGACGDRPWDFPEEFWSCSENIQIFPKNGGKSRTPQIFHDGEFPVEGPYY